MSMINFNQTFVDLSGEMVCDGKTIQDETGKASFIEDKSKPLSLLVVSQRCLVAAFEDEKDLAGEEKVKRWELALRINSPEPVEIGAEDIVLLKKLISKMGYGIIIVGQAWNMLEGK